MYLFPYVIVTVTKKDFKSIVMAYLLPGLWHQYRQFFLYDSFSIFFTGMVFLPVL
jgi:hypothetical protein